MQSGTFESSGGEAKNVALLGTGLMGFPIARRLLQAEYQVTVYNRTVAKAEPLRTQGAEVAASPVEAVGEARCVILMLSDAQAVEEVLFGEEPTDLQGKAVIQMGTIAPEESRTFEQRVREAGGDYLECPVLGSRNEAEKGELLLMFGGSPEQMKKWTPLLEAMGRPPVLVGPVGKAAALKLAMNQLIASLAVAFSSSLALVEKSDVDRDIFMGVLKESALFAPMFEKKLPTIIGRKYTDPNFPAKHMLKDVGLLLNATAELQIDTRTLDKVRELFQKNIDQGRGESDYISVFEAVRQK